MSQQHEERVKHLFGKTIELYISAADTLSEQISLAGQRMVQCLLNNGKIMVVASGGSSGNAYHFTNAMINFFDVARPSLPAMNLAADASMLSSFASEGHYNQAFARQIQALGSANDILLVLTTSGNSDAMIYAKQAAGEQGMDTIALTGRDGGVFANHFAPDDIEVRVKADSAYQIRELHLFILHTFCDLIDQSLFGQLSG